MRTPHIILLLLLAWGALCASWAWRRQRASRYPFHLRLRSFQWAAGLSLAALAAPFFASKKPPVGQMLTGVFLALVWAVLLWNLRRKHAGELAEEKIRKERDRNKPSGGKEAPQSFFWQGLLILLPMTLLATFGLLAIGRDRAEVEATAQKRAQEVMVQMTDNLGRLAAQPLSDYEQFSSAWAGYYRQLAEQWPEKPSADDLQRLERLQAGLAWAGKILPEIGPGCRFTLNGLWQAQGEYAQVPEPAAWYRNLTPPQREAWEKLKAAARKQAGEEEVGSLRDELVAMVPGDEIRLNADFMRLFARPPGLPEKETETFVGLSALSVICREEGYQTESGVPLASLAWAEAWRRNGTNVISRDLWMTLCCQMHSYPSPLLPLLLAEVKARAPTSSSLAEAIQAQEMVWRQLEQQRELARRLRTDAHVMGVTVTNLWLDWQGERWFVTLQPTVTHTYRMDGNGQQKMFTETNYLASVALYPREIMERAWRWALQEKIRRIAPPDYLGFSVVLDKEPLALGTECWSKHQTGPVLAEMQDRMTRPAVMIPPSSPFATGKAAANPSDPETGVPFESLPSRPRFTLRVHLADRNLLLAEQQRRAWLFGSLIALAAGAALVGFVTARRAFYREQRLNGMKSNFVASVSHELRAPIASVRLMAEGLERGKIVEPQKQQEYYRFIGQECRRLSALIENVLDFSRIEQGRKQYEPEPTDVAKLVTETVRLMQPYAAEKNVRLELAPTLTEGTAAPMLDGRAIQQALVNLVDNAIKHSPNGAAVTVTWGERMAGDGGKFLFISVQDAGPGIPAAEQKKIFERFYRLGSELRRETQGIGIGLSIVQHVVEAHGGRIQVDSTVGQGSVFTIEIPMPKEVPGAR